MFVKKHPKFNTLKLKNPKTAWKISKPEAMQHHCSSNSFLSPSSSWEATHSPTCPVERVIIKSHPPEGQLYGTPQHPMLQSTCGNTEQRKPWSALQSKSWSRRIQHITLITTTEWLSPWPVLRVSKAAPKSWPRQGKGQLKVTGQTVCMVRTRPRISNTKMQEPIVSQAPINYTSHYNN